MTLCKKLIIKVKASIILMLDLNIKLIINYRVYPIGVNEMLIMEI